jgi:DNA polymerase-3 subunit gamma/tau
MTYLVLARKYRPRNFAQLVGQEHVVRALDHALREQRLHHAYLFTGTRGVGKTTLSRILAKALNCVGADGMGDITPEPCGVCEACIAIDAGRFIDYVEMDAASNRGVDEMAALLERAIYAPTAARFKVFMLDEVHMLTGHAFNAMLKTLEEPPPHLKFILATTDPQKVPVTVLSRCLQFNLKQMPPAHIVGHLGEVLAQEEIPYEPNALRLIAHAAHGSMRDALSLTDQAIAYSAAQVTEDAVRTMLGAVDTTFLVRICDALLAEDGQALIAVADDMNARSLSLSNALQELALMFQRIAVAQRVPEAIPDDLPEAADLRRLAAAFDAQEAQLHYQIAIAGRNELALAPDEYAGFTMTLLRMLAFRPSLLGTAGGSSNGVASAPKARHESVAGKEAAPVNAREALASLRASTGATAGAPAVAPAIAPAVAPATPATRANSPLLAPRPAAATAVPSVAVKVEPVSEALDSSSEATLIEIHGDWPSVIAQLDLKGLVRELARQSELVAIEGRHVRLKVAQKPLTEGPQIERLQAALSQHFGVSVKLSVEVGKTADTVAVRADVVAANLQDAAEQAFHAAPLVRQLIDQYGATLIAGSVRPIPPGETS